MTSNVATKDDISNLSSLISNVLERLTNIETGIGDKVEKLEERVLKLKAKKQGFKR